MALSWWSACLQNPHFCFSHLVVPPSFLLLPSLVLEAGKFRLEDMSLDMILKFLHLSLLHQMTKSESFLNSVHLSLLTPTPGTLVACCVICVCILLCSMSVHKYAYIGIALCVQICVKYVYTQVLN